LIVAFDGKIGGVGKSLGAAAYGESLAARGIPFTVIEADVNANVSKYFRDVAEAIVEVDMLDAAGWLDLSSAIAAKKSGEVILSLPAGSRTAEHADMLAGAVAESTQAMTLVWMMNRTPESVRLFDLLHRALKGSPVKLVAARNLFFGTEQRFGLWNDSDARKAFLKGRGLEVNFPELNDKAVDRTFAAHPVVRLSATGETSGLDYGYRFALGRWLEQTAAMFEMVAEKPPATVVVNA
jgi:hypothetical protein